MTTLTGSALPSSREVEDVSRLTFSLDAPPLSDDPHRPLDYNSIFVGHALIRPLLSDSSESATDGCAIEVSPTEEGRRWRVVLDTRLRWSDGRPLRSDDAVRSVASLAHGAASGLPSLTRVTKADDATMEIVFERPVAHARALFTQVSFAPSRQGPRARAVPGAPTLGRYTVAIRGRTGLRLIANTANGEHPDCRILDFAVYRDNHSMLRAFANGKVDVTSLTSLGIKEVAALDDDVRVTRRPLRILGSLEFGKRSNPLWDHPDSRRTLSAVLDRVQISRALGGLVRPLTRHMALFGEPAADVVLEEASADASAFGSLAGRLREATIAYADFPPNGVVVRQIAAQLAALGVRLRTTPLSYADYVRAAALREFDLLYTLTVADYPHPSSLLSVERVHRPRSGEKFRDSLLEARTAAAETCVGNEAMERAGWLRVEDRWLELMPRIPLVQVVAHGLVSTRVGHMPVGASGLVPFWAISLATNESRRSTRGGPSDG